VVHRVGTSLGSYDLSRPWHGLDETWMADGACRGDIPSRTKDGFFLDLSTKVEAKVAVLEAKQLCETCPVYDACRSYAYASDPQGVWAGQTGKERRAEIKAGRKRKATPPAQRAS
jgi:hypothetical protein